MKKHRNMKAAFYTVEPYAYESGVSTILIICSVSVSAVLGSSVHSGVRLPGSNPTPTTHLLHHLDLH